MGAMKRVMEARNAKASQGKAKQAGSKLLSKINHMDGKATQGDASWERVSDSLITWLVRRVSAEGGLVTFGTTRDGGALKVSIYDSGEKHDEYFGAQEDISMAVWSFCLQLCDNDEEAPVEP